MNAEQKNYSPDNWAHQALLLMDDADALVRWAAVSHPDPEKYKAAAKAFWDVCHLLGDERRKLHNAEVSRSAPLLAQVGSTDGLCDEVKP